MAPVDIALTTVSMDIVCLPVLSYAMTHNRMSLVDRITLRNSGEAVTEARVQVELVGAHGVVSDFYEVAVDLAGGADTVLTPIDVRVDPAKMLHIDEQQRGRVRVAVLRGDDLLGHADAEIVLLAPRQWLRRPAELSHEILAAFVIPNDPAINALLSEAATVLQERTGSSSIEGYQSGAQRVDQIVHAIYTAMQARRIRYCMPPASWADDGQKVRTPSDVLVGRLGTCLDTTVVLAAALEQAGVRPLLWVVEGHAFLAYWREETALQSSVASEYDQLVNFIDRDLMRLVETTSVTERAETIDFSATHRPPYLEYLTGSLDRIHGVTDVYAARHNDILPLPAVRRLDDGRVEVFEYHAAEHSSPFQVRARDAVSPVTSAGRSPTPARVQQWKNSLLDLSLRNKLINFSDRYSVALTVPDGGLGTIEDLINEPRSLQLLPSDQIDEVHVARGSASAAYLPQEQLRDILVRKNALYSNVPLSSYSTRMRGLAHKARTIVEETGANNLYLALGSLLWSIDGKKDVVRSPLILVPVQLVTRARSQTYRLELDDSGVSTPNFCLLEKLRQVCGLEVPGLAEPEMDGSGIDLDAALDAVRAAVAHANLPYRVAPTADLAILQFAKFRLWKDLDEHWEALAESPLVRHLVETPTEAFIDPVTGPSKAVDLDELDAVCPVAADASQLEAVAAAVTGRTFVLEGPPGTGKSQTITNMLTRSLAEGKRVLFVAEKRAALDVVRSRLDAVGIGPFSLDLHDKGSRPVVVRTQIKAALDHAVAVDTQGLSAQQEELRAARRALARYNDRLHEQNDAGLSYYSARTVELALGQDLETLSVPTSLVTGTGAADTLADLRRLLVDLPDVAEPVRPRPHHPWGFSGLTSLDTVDMRALAAALTAADERLQSLPVAGPLADVLRSARTVEDFTALAGLLSAEPVPLAVLDQSRSESWRNATAALGREIGTFVAVAHPGLDVATPSAIDLPLADLHAQAKAAAASGWFGRKKRLRAVLDQLAPGLRPGAEVPLKNVPQLTAALLQVQGAVRSLAERATGLSGIHVPSAWNPLTAQGRELVQRQVDWLTWAGATVDAADPAAPPFTAAVRRYLDSGAFADVPARTAVEAATWALLDLATRCASDAALLSSWSGECGLLDRWRVTSSGRDLSDPDLRGLNRWTSFLSHVEPLNAVGMAQARDQLVSGAVEAADAVRALDRGVARTSLAERRDASGLDAFNAEAHNRTIERFLGRSADVRHQMLAALPEQILDSRPFRAGAAGGQVGALQRELAKQRRGLGVRSLLEAYGELITQVMPCVLVSPDSLARFFPVGAQLFDLVVFDEASQIRVADAIGAIGRSRAVVVVGDSKQMPPTVFGDSGFDDVDDPASDELLAVADEESILTECVQAMLPRRWLSWHYRSQDESLIAFSNSHYYEGKLSSFPAPTAGYADAGVAGHGVSLVRVDGQFQRSGKGKLLRTNPVEAKAVVEEVRRRFDHAVAGTAPSIGIVTFNQQQRALIEAMIRDDGDERLVEALDGAQFEGLFIKNLENVQGDERDVILFSTAFSVNDKGVLPLNFGPLNRGGGERRLNVAVTRARRQVLIFSSFEPGQLRVEETKSTGVRHLRAYLDMASAKSGVTVANAAPRLATDRHRDDIAEALRRRGLHVQTDVGLSDFRIDLAVALPAEPDRLVMAVLLDGEGWHGRRTVGDRDGLPKHVLTNLLGWPAVERVWLPAWLEDSDKVLDNLERAASAATVSAASAQRSQRSAHAPVRAASSRVALAAPPPALRATATLPGEHPFAAWEPGSLGSRDVLDSLPSPSAARGVRAALESAVDAEGPIHADRLARAVAAAFGLSRVSAGRARAILAHLPMHLESSDSEMFAWPTGLDPAAWTGFRRSGGDDGRPVEHVSLRELGNAMVALCAVSAGMQEDELLRECLAVFGGKRRTAGIQRRLQDALDASVKADRLTQQPDGHFVVA